MSAVRKCGFVVAILLLVCGLVMPFVGLEIAIRGNDADTGVALMVGALFPVMIGMGLLEAAA